MNVDDVPSPGDLAAAGTLDALVAKGAGPTAGGGR